MQHGTPTRAIHAAIRHAAPHRDEARHSRVATATTILPDACDHDRMTARPAGPRTRGDRASFAPPARPANSRPTPSHPPIRLSPQQAACAIAGRR